MDCSPSSVWVSFVYMWSACRVGVGAVEDRDGRAKLLLGRKEVQMRERSAILPRNTDFFERWFLSFVSLPKVTLRTSAVTEVLHAHIFSDNEECRPSLQYVVHKRPQEVIYKWKNIPCSKRLEALCAALTRRKSKRWNICGVRVPKVREGASCKEWLFNPSDSQNKNQ